MPNEPPHPPNPPKKKLTRKMAFILAERTQESGGNYLVVNANSGALGAWQVMPSNLPGWLRASNLPSMTPYQYLHNPKAQNHLAWVILGGYYNRYGARGAAAMWYSGQSDPNKTYGDPPVYVYVNDVIALMKRRGFPIDTGSQGSGPGAYTLPPPHEGDWSTHVASTASSHRNMAAGLTRYSAALHKIR
jgi:hypothetical protein